MRWCKHWKLHHITGIRDLEHNHTCRAKENHWICYHSCKYDSDAELTKEESALRPWDLWLQLGYSLTSQDNWRNWRWNSNKTSIDRYRPRRSSSKSKFSACAPSCLTDENENFEDTTSRPSSSCDPNLNDGAPPPSSRWYSSWALVLNFVSFFVILMPKERKLS